MSQHHPSEELLLQYAAGVLPEGLGLFVATHLNYCSACRADVRTAELIGGALLSDDEGRVPAAQQLNGHAADVMIARAADSRIAAPMGSIAGTDVPHPLRAYIGPRFDAIRWRTIWPGVQTYALAGLADEGEVGLLRIKPGMAMPQHTHRGEEHTMVLQGAFSDESGRYGVGDVSIADDAVIHRPVAEAGTACICLTVVDAPLHFTSRLTNLVSKLLLR
jgi:putative transcriptional regulator